MITAGNLFGGRVIGKRKYWARDNTNYIFVDSWVSFVRFNYYSSVFFIFILVFGWFYFRCYSSFKNPTQPHEFPVHAIVY